jgi:hypothetical protein
MQQTQSGTLVVPDITGFTKFVQETDFDQGKYITQQLLLAIIESNTLGLQVSEIEGDAVLFYKMGEPPSADQIAGQFARMTDRFYHKLRELSQTLGQPFNLDLKLVVHYGKIAEYSIQGFTKLYGQPVIEVHKLLKNSVESRQYILFTEEYLRVSKNGLPGRVPKSQHYEQYDGLGTLCYTCVNCPSVD